MTDDQAIPKRLHFIWVGSPMPERLQVNVQRWRDMHPDWTTYVWTDKNIPILRNGDLYRRAKQLVPADAVGQFRADIIRYELLYDFGGFYADVDTVPLKLIDDALTGHQVFAAMEDRNWIGNTYLGAVPGHKIFRDLVGLLPKNVKRLGAKRPNHLSGPRYLTPIWRAHSGYTAPSHLFYPYSYSDVKNGTVPDDYHRDAYCVHQWYHTESVLEARRARTR
jgi:mannosyltransferase OCH1-like enzyme